jgi:hypothetical protein
MMILYEHRDFVLRRSVQPYVGFVGLMSIGTIFCLWSFIRWSDLSFLWSILFLWTISSVWLCMGLSYRIAISGDALLQRAFGVRTIVLPLRLIKSVKLESTLGARRKNSFVNRPFRRIVICNSADPEGYVDVSLKHFLAADIRALLQRIHAERPNVALPKDWM